MLNLTKNKSRVLQNRNQRRYDLKVIIRETSHNVLSLQSIRTTTTITKSKLRTSKNGKSGSKT